MLHHQWPATTSVIAGTCSALLFVLLACDGANPARERPPNIVLVISDDQDWRDFGFMGSGVAHTPALDALAQGGVVFTQGFNTGSSCRASLQTLLTGLYPVQIKVRERAQNVGRRDHAGHRRILRELETLPERLAARGYVSFQGGKLWDGSFRDAGFSEGTALHDDDESDPQPGWGRLYGGAGTRLGRESMEPLLRFVDEHADEPFFVWFAPMLPHLPHDPPRQYLHPYARSGLARADRLYYGNVTRLDARVGELLDHLEERGLRQETLVVFLADNGWDQAGRLESPHIGIGGPRGKLSMYDSGFRTPIVFSWPGTLRPRRDESHLVSTVDLVPTLLEFAGASSGNGELPGRSLRALLTDDGGFDRNRVYGGMNVVRAPDFDKGSRPPREALILEEAYFVRGPRWRFVWYPGLVRRELYDLQSDPDEQHDLATKRPDLARTWQSELEKWLRRMGRDVSGTSP